MVREGFETRLTGPELELAWSALGHQDLPLVLELRSHGATVGENARLLELARGSLALRGLWHDGVPSSGLARSLAPLVAPDVEVDVRGRGPSGRWRALVATRNGATVLAVQRDGALALTSVSGGSMPAAALSTLPDALPGTGQLNAISSELHQSVARAGNDSRRLFEALLALDTPEADARALAAAIPTAHGSAQIGAAARIDGHRRRAPRVVALLDTELGRYVVTENLSQDRVRWTTYAPATPLRVHQSVAEMHAGISSGVGGVGPR